MKTHIAFVFLFIALVSSSCMENLKVDKPSYIYIEPFQVVYDKAITTGTGRYNISDAWLYINDQPYGLFRPPVKVPIESVGKTNIKIGAGIRINGISASRVEYPFYLRYEVDTTLYADSIIRLKPIVKYSDVTAFPLLEDFESSATIFDTVNGSKSFLQRIENQGLDSFFYGSFTARALLNEQTPNLHILSKNLYVLPKAGIPVYLEMDYKTTVKLQVNLVFLNTENVVRDIPIITLNPTNRGGELSWNKIYIELTNDVSYTPSALSFGISFLAFKPRETDGEVWFDNIKIVHR